MQTDDSQASGKDAVEKWLNKTGFPLQMRVAYQLEQYEDRDKSMLVRQGTIYHNSRLNETREVDVHVEASGSNGINLHLDVVFAIECKNTSTPWVLFRSPEGQYEFPRPGVHLWFLDHFVLSKSEQVSLESQKRVMGRFLNQQPAFWFSNPPHTYSATEAFRTKNSPDGPYDAGRQAVSASMAILDELEDEELYPPQQSLGTVTLVMPIVVTTSPLFTARLDARGQMEVSEVKVAQVAMTRPDAPRKSIAVRVVNSQALDQLCQEVRQACDIVESIASWIGPI